MSKKHSKTLVFPRAPKAAQRAAEDPILHIAVCIPSRDYWDSRFGYRLARLMAFTGASLCADGLADLQLHMVNGSLVDSSRCTLVKEALEAGATHLFWLDTDMTFPHDTIVRLLRHNKPIVTVNAPTRRFPIQPTAFKRIDYQHGLHARLYTEEDSTGLEEVEACGFSVALMQAKIFEKIPVPGFLTTYDKGTGHWKGEDVYFCEQARAAGFPILVDHDLSKLIGHVGVMEYRLDHALAMRELDAESGVRSGIVVPEGVLADGAVNLQ